LPEEQIGEASCTICRRLRILGRRRRSGPCDAHGSAEPPRGKCREFHLSGVCRAFWMARQNSGHELGLFMGHRAWALLTAQSIWPATPVGRRPAAGLIWIAAGVFGMRSSDWPCRPILWLSMLIVATRGLGMIISSRRPTRLIQNPHRRPQRGRGDELLHDGVHRHGAVGQSAGGQSAKSWAAACSARAPDAADRRLVVIVAAVAFASPCRPMRRVVRADLCPQRRTFRAMAEGQSRRRRR